MKNKIYHNTNKKEMIKFLKEKEKIEEKARKEFDLWLTKKLFNDKYD